MNHQKRVGLVGASGYVAYELMGVLCRHPHFTLTQLVSHSQAGKNLTDLMPAFKGILDLPLNALDPDQLADTCDFVITALPHGISSTVVPELLARGLRVLDHSGDFRYRDVSVYEAVYQLKHPRPDLLDQAVYGFPEGYRDQLADADLVANPGCYPTCSLIALMPLLKSGLIDPATIIIDASSGVSGAGRQHATAFSFCEAAESFRAYGAVGHRHTSEIEQEAGLMTADQSPLKLTFTPHLAPMKRGLFATVYATLKPGVDPQDLLASYQTTYANEPFVRVLPQGQLPDTKHVVHSNFADCTVLADPRTGTVKMLCAIDNLGKGAAWQAIQALNIMAGFDETAGLIQPGRPI